LAVAERALEGWPRPLLRLYLGQATPDEVRVAAKMGSDEKARACQASFYVGEYHWLRGNLNTAVPILSEAAIACPHEMLEYDGAISELGRLP
jgi:lipoprotein NlpI